MKNEEVNLSVVFGDVVADGDRFRDFVIRNLDVRDQDSLNKRQVLRPLKYLALQGVILLMVPGHLKLRLDVL